MLDIKNLKRECNKFLTQNRGKLAWDSYEVQLARERVMNEKLYIDLADKGGHKIEELVKESDKVAYPDYIRPHYWLLRFNEASRR